MTFLPASNAERTKWDVCKQMFGEFLCVCVFLWGKKERERGRGCIRVRLSVCLFVCVRVHLCAGVHDEGHTNYRTQKDLEESPFLHGWRWAQIASARIVSCYLILGLQLSHKKSHLKEMRKYHASWIVLYKEQKTMAWYIYPNANVAMHFLIVWIQL